VLASGRYPRARVDIHAECMMGDEKFPAHITMLGGGGLLLETGRKLESQAVLRVRFRLAYNLPLIEAAVCVRYQIPDLGTGVEFIEIRPEDRQVILRLILRRITEKPRYARRKFVARIEYVDGSYLGFSRDISVGGMFVETRTPLPEGSVFKLCFHLGDDGPLITAEAEVCYMVMNLCMGIEFTDLSPADRTRIEAYVAKAESGS